MAQIHLHQNNFKLANQSLEVGLSYNFEVRQLFVSPVCELFSLFQQVRNSSCRNFFLGLEFVHQNSTWTPMQLVYHRTLAIVSWCNKQYLLHSMVIQ